MDLNPKKLRTMTRILRHIDKELAALLDNEPDFYGKVPITLNFKKGRCVNLNWGGAQKTIQVEGER